MRKFQLLLAPLTMLALVAACGQSDSPTVTPVRLPMTTAPTAVGTPVPTPFPQVAVGRPFELKVGQTIELSGAQLLITFKRVANDSRCPIDVVCIRAGDATVELSLSAKGQSTELAVVIGPERPGAATVTFAGYRITGQGLIPAPRAGTSVPQADYVVTLLVEAA